MKIAWHLLQISWRNVFRNKRRTALTLLILVLGSTGLILVGGFFDYIVEGLGEYFIHSQTGHLQISRKGYYEKGASAPFQYLMKGEDQIKREIESNPHVLYTVPRLKFSAMANSDETSLAVLGLGVDPVLEKKMGSYRQENNEKGSPPTNIISGEDLDPAEPYGVIVGKGLMNNLGLKVGDPISLIVSRQSGTIDGAEFRVRGVFETLLQDFNERAIKVNLATAQKLLDVPNQVHSLLVVLDQTEKTLEVKKELVTAFASKGYDLESVDWIQQGSYYRQSKDFLNKIYVTVQFIISIIFFFSIANTINMNLFERMREFGTMMAIGNERTILFGMVLLEAAILGCMGAVLGICIGSGVAETVSAIGIKMPPPPMGSFGYLAVISLKPLLLLKVFAISFFSTILACLIPAYRASHLRIVQALGYI